MIYGHCSTQHASHQQCIGVPQKSGIIFKSPRIDTPPTRLFTLLITIAGGGERKKRKERKKARGRCADISRRVRGGKEGEGGGLGCTAVWRKHHSVGPSKQHLFPETERTWTTDADVNASSHSDLYLIITFLQRPFLISVRCRFLHQTPPFLVECTKKKGNGDLLH